MRDAPVALNESRPMRTITTTEDLAAFCTAAKEHPYVTIDTEFLRERTYWSKLCLIQLAMPGDDGDAVLVDPIEGSAMSMEPLYDLFRHEATVKVFHAARQDLEIFFVEGNVFPKPLFDTQVAAMVCGSASRSAMKPWCARSRARIWIKPHASPIGRAVP
jgi:ribonuclease D